MRSTRIGQDSGVGLRRPTQPLHSRRGGRKRAVGWSGSASRAQAEAGGRKQGAGFEDIHHPKHCSLLDLIPFGLPLYDAKPLEALQSNPNPGRRNLGGAGGREGARLLGPGEGNDISPSLIVPGSLGPLACLRTVAILEFPSHDDCGTGCAVCIDSADILTVGPQALANSSEPKGHRGYMWISAQRLKKCRRSGIGRSEMKRGALSAWEAPLPRDWGLNFPTLARRGEGAGWKGAEASLLRGPSMVLLLSKAVNLARGHPVDHEKQVTPILAGGSFSINKMVADLVERENGNLHKTCGRERRSTGQIKAGHVNSRVDKTGRRLPKEIRNLITAQIEGVNRWGAWTPAAVEKRVLLLTSRHVRTKAWPKCAIWASYYETQSYRTMRKEGPIERLAITGRVALILGDVPYGNKRGLGTRQIARKTRSSVGIHKTRKEDPHLSGKRIKNDKGGYKH
ncbi:hypothetical protein BJV78DRAFT_1156595 [Lactifluus subvellereus]|nr:hypothetical protein BJV78DRAFT_1156595 [Lactifluus subvellereus]